MQDQKDLLVGVDKIELGPWRVNLHPQSLQVSPLEQNELLKYAQDWSKIFPNDPLTFAQKTWGVPSVIIRFDYSFVDGKVYVYEIEDRPTFLAVLPLYSEQFREKFTTCVDNIRLETGRPVVMVVAPSRLENSDDVLHSLLTTPIFDGVYQNIDEVPEDALVIVRSERTESEYYHFEPRSLSTISKEGWKGYGVHLGLWEEINESNVDYSLPFALKPEFGCRSDNIFLFHPKRNTVNKKGFSTRTAIERAISENVVKYIQPYHSPEKHDFLGDKHLLIRRVYFGFDPKGMEFKCLGGVYMARDCAKVHGASDTTTGLMLV